MKTRLRADDLHDCLQALTEGGCDFLLCYSHARIPLLLDATEYPSIVIGTDCMIPVTGTDGDGAPLFQFPGTKDIPIPYLSYSDDSFLGRVEEIIIQDIKAPLFVDRRYENSMGDALKAMALAGYGAALLPESLMEQELADGRLVRAGDSSWEFSMEVRIYRSLEKTRPQVEEIWSYLQEESAADP